MAHVTGDCDEVSEDEVELGFTKLGSGSMSWMLDELLPELKLMPHKLTMKKESMPWMLEETLTELKLVPQKPRRKKEKIARKTMKRGKKPKREKKAMKSLLETRTSKNYSMGCTSIPPNLYELIACEATKVDDGLQLDKDLGQECGVKLDQEEECVDPELDHDWNSAALKVDDGLQLDKDLNCELDSGQECGVKLDQEEECGDSELDHDLNCIKVDDGLPLDKDLDKLDPGQERGVKLDQKEECGIVPELDPDWNCGFDSDLDPDWNAHHVVSWDEHVVQALQIVRLYEITEDDPVRSLPVRTRFCKFNIALFDFEKESKASRGPPILELTSRDRIKLADSINIVSLKILKSDVDYPISVFGTVLVRDQFDYKCIYVFRRDKDNAQVINSPEDTLTLSDPLRGLAITNGMFFEINLKIKCGDSGETDFSKGVIERDVFVHQNRKLITRSLTSWHSRVQLSYTPVPVAVAAHLAINILKGPRDFFIGQVYAWTSGNKNQIILYDSKVEGTETAIGDGGSVVLSRCLVAVPVKEDLQLCVCVREGGCEAACFELILCHLDDRRICFQGSYEIEVMVEWTAILNRSEKGVFRHLGYTTLLV